MNKVSGLQVIKYFNNKKMQKFLFLFVLSISCVWANDLKKFNLDFFTQGSDTYILIITGEQLIDDKEFKTTFKNKVKDICGTRFEILSTEFDHILEDEQKRKILQGSFKCHVTSQM